MTKFIMKTRRLLRNKKGFTLVEVLVAIALLGIVMPLTFELFNLGADMMAKSQNMLNTSDDVSYVLDSSRPAGYPDVDEITQNQGTFTINYNNLTGVNNQILVDYSGRSDGDVVYYTFSPYLGVHNVGLNILEGKMIAIDYTKVNVNGWSIYGVGNDTRKQINSTVISVTANTAYNFACTYWTSDGTTLDDIYLQFNGTGYPEANVYLQPTTSGYSTNVTNTDLGDGWWRRAGTFVTTANTTQITQVFFDSDTNGLQVFISRDITITRAA